MDHSEVKHFPKVDHTPAELDEVSKVMLKAADLIEKRGLAKDERQCFRTGAFCVHGALAYAETGGAFNDGKCEPLAAHRIFKSLGDDALKYGCNPTGVAGWNNAPERTQAEVVSKLRAVALGL